MAVNTNIFPPAITTYMPAFVIGNSCRIYFSITAYNNIDDLKNFVQVTIVNQNTNKTVLNSTKYPCEIMLKTFLEDISIDTDYKYYIDIANNDIQGGFNNNQYYKVQLRFTAAAATNPPSGATQAIDSWLAANLEYFSEWSSVCLIRGISQPILELSNFDLEEAVSWPSTNVDIVGKLVFADSAEQDALKRYHIKLYNEEDELLQDCGDVFTSNFTNLNEINYSLNYLLEEDTLYYFTIEYETNNLYSEILVYYFDTAAGSGDILNATLSVEPQDEDGRFKIHLTSAAAITGEIVFRRSSSRSNFNIWEDVNSHTFNNTTANYIWYDYTIESGVFYKYIAQKKTNSGRGVPISAQGEPFAMLFNDIFLVGQNKQLRIKFDPNINSFRKAIIETSVETIGSKYPFICRNGNVNYSQFSLSGLISSAMDKNDYTLITTNSIITEGSPSIEPHTEIGYNYGSTFTSKEELLGANNLTYYQNYNNNEYRRINDYNDWTYEREFRKAVLDFLTNDEVKLYKSATEGNFLIKLLDINLTPNQTLGRRMYNFSANAYEIDDYSFSKCKEYKILSTE